MRALLLIPGLLATTTVMAAEYKAEPVPVPELKAVYGRVEARDTVPARARIGGVVVELLVTEGDLVKAGQKIATVRDDKLDFQIAAQDAQLRALASQLDTAESELKRAEALVAKGVITKQRLDQLQTAADVARNQIAATEAQRKVLEQQGAEGEVLAPADGRVLTVPVTKGAVIMAGEPAATIGGGGFFLRLAIPERHARSLKSGAQIQIVTPSGKKSGTLVKIYPQITNGRVVADVEVEDLSTEFVDARILVQVPVGTREALIVPQEALIIRSGLEFVPVMEDGKTVERTVVTGETIDQDGKPYVEILTGLEAGDTVVTP
ncbi:efflux transporter periplasmic adaptor subunit [Zhengella mangrovi]|uniref:Efflux transporter periplasmic adaptor subunit n=1 Tax=Zhengella mangrovi TaxID=1982044 RepID=A0A2G1QT20_9HYPH|nr:efflux RND transporter periplasmic adaptor subunit [Zhengella mangrovi]PHP68686.1 efflux transporter periplasmic adaptor subunit [Zhengella mangrovi]